MKDERKQLGVRVPVKMVDALKRIGTVLKVPRQQLAEDAIALWMGIKEDPMARTRREMAIKAIKRGKVELPNPLTMSGTLQAA